MKTTPVCLIVAGMLLPCLVLAQDPAARPGPPPGSGGHPDGPPRPLMEAWKKADSNHDGILSKEEFDAMPRVQKLPDEKRVQLFNRLDKDGDGKISRPELEHLGKPHDRPGPPMQRLWELDADKSGGISFLEFKTGLIFGKLPLERQQELFHRLDSNKDGLITPQDKPQPPFKREGGRPHPKPPEDVHLKDPA